MKTQSPKPHNEQIDARRLFLKIRSKYPDMTRAAKQIADYILANYEETKYLSISSLAERVNVSESMITKFVRILGVRGYQDFKVRLALSQDNHAPAAEIFGEVSLDDDAASICRRIYTNNVETLRDSLSLLNFRDVDRAAELIVKARRVEFYGSGGSSIALANAQARFHRIGIMCFTFCDGHTQLMSASLLGRQDVAVAVSNSGRSASVVEALQIAKKMGASTICITNYEETPLTAHADVRLFTSSRDVDRLSENLHSRIAELALIDSLYVIVASKMKARALENLKTTAEVIRRHRLTRK
ncbi:MAG: MurR/RpiR family transcriptional regulator [Spirochaetia bacterium]|jgi:DNA-binding MurR/RpiR family transcriptional regulator